MTNGQKMRKLFEEKKLVVAPGCHDALTAKNTAATDEAPTSTSHS